MPLSKDEKEWAEEQMALFTEHQNRKMVADFWPQIRAAFFAKFPLDGEDNPEMDSELRAALGKASDKKFQSLKHYFNNTSVNNTSRKARSKVHTALKIYLGSSPSQKVKAIRSLKKREVYARLFYESECKEKVDAAILAFGPAITKKDRMTIRNQHINAGFQASQLDPSKMDAIEEYIAEQNTKRNDQTILGDETDSEIQPLTGAEHTLFMRALPTTLAEISTSLATLGGLCTMFVAAGMDPDNDNKIRGYGFHVGKDVHGQPFFRAIPDYTERILRPFLNFASVALVADNKSSSTPLSMSDMYEFAETADSTSTKTSDSSTETVDSTSTKTSDSSTETSDLSLTPPPTTTSAESCGNSISQTPSEPLCDPSTTQDAGILITAVTTPLITTPQTNAPLPSSFEVGGSVDSTPFMSSGVNLMPTGFMSGTHSILHAPSTPISESPATTARFPSRSLSMDSIWVRSEESSHQTRSSSMPPSWDSNTHPLSSVPPTPGQLGRLPNAAVNSSQSLSWDMMTDHEFDTLVATTLDNFQAPDWVDNTPVGVNIADMGDEFMEPLSPPAVHHIGLGCISSTPIINESSNSTLGPQVLGSTDITMSDSTSGPTTSAPTAPTTLPPLIDTVNPTVPPPTTTRDTTVPDPVNAAPTATDALFTVHGIPAVESSSSSPNIGSIVTNPLTPGHSIPPIELSSLSSNLVSGSNPTGPALLAALLAKEPALTGPETGSPDDVFADGTPTSEVVAEADGREPSSSCPLGLNPAVGDKPNGPALLAALLIQEPALTGPETGSPDDVFADGTPTSDVMAEANGREPSSSSPNHVSALGSNPAVGGNPTGPALLAALLAKEPAILTSLESGTHENIFAESTPTAAGVATEINLKGKIGKSKSKGTRTAKSNKISKAPSKPLSHMGTQDTNNDNLNSGNIKIIVGHGKIKVTVNNVDKPGDALGSAKENTLPSLTESSSRPKRTYNEPPSREPITIHERNARMMQKRTAQDAGLNNAILSKKAKLL
ncbi:hypothetical protein C8J55DRAFT_563857 [Lentinula edodes]|uniref:Uncharacterized protein n=1 Tax=Lentinula lateritia TaxID=40482 RepID=A0A9W9A104_9AGAR|nr:hypothetical protein C8J55DRAFT_563857 [Lentinula edodes]